jgi:hypothetical protein
VLHRILHVMLANQDNPAGSAPQAAPQGPPQTKHRGRR